MSHENARRHSASPCERLAERRVHLAARQGSRQAGEHGRAVVKRAWVILERTKDFASSKQLSLVTCQLDDVSFALPPAPSPSAPQRLQRFSTFGHLKQLVLKMIVDEIQDEGKQGKAPASRKARAALGNLQVGFGTRRRVLRRENNARVMSFL